MRVRALCHSLIGCLLAGTVGCARACGREVDKEEDEHAGRQTDSDAGSARDAGRVVRRDAGIAASPPAVTPSETLDCAPRLVGTPMRITNAESGLAHPSFAWTGDGVVGVWPADGLVGYRVIELNREGLAQAPVRTLWPEAPSGEDPRIAVSSDVLAIVDQVVADASSSQPICRVALAQLNDGGSILVPTRIGDAPESDSPRGEAGQCNVVAVGDGFLLVWRQNISRTSQAWSLFAQRVARDGAEQGERLMIATGEDSTLDGVWISSDGVRALIAHSLSGDPRPRLTYVEGEGLTPAEPGFTGPLTDLAFARGSFLARTADGLWLLDGAGRVQGDPIDVGPRGSLAPLADGFVAVSQQELLVARAFDRELAASSALVPLSNSPGASLETLVFAPDGSETLAIFHDGGVFLAPLECSDQPITPVSASSCTPALPLAPLPNGCNQPVCHVVIRIDYLTLNVRGWTVRGGSFEPVDQEGARSIAFDVFNANDTSGSLVLDEADVSDAPGGLFNVSVPPLDTGAVALIGAQSGAVIMVGSVERAGRGGYWIPTQWNSEIDIACGPRPLSATAQYVEPDLCRADHVPLDSLPASADDALAVALRSNLAAFLAERGPFSAHVHLYTPALDPCDARVAEYLVVLSQTLAK